jgi:hypothetical protein
MVAYSHARAEASKAARRAGIEYAKPRGNRAYIGRQPSFTREQFVRVRAMLGQEAHTHRERTGLTRQTAYRIKGDAEVHWRLAGCG